MQAKPAPTNRPAPASWPRQTVLDRLLEAGGEGWTVIYHLKPDGKAVLKLFLRYGAKTWRMNGQRLPTFRPPTAAHQQESMTAEPGVTIWRQAATRTPPDLIIASGVKNRFVMDVVLEKLKEISKCSTSSSTSPKPSAGRSPSSDSDSSPQAWPTTERSEVRNDP